jgi:hypothetical protein
MVFLKGLRYAQTYQGRRVYRFKKGKFFSGTALFWTLLPEDAGALTLAHEHGHHIQGNRWGWLYLPVIGIASLVNNLRSRMKDRVASHYYELYPEREADLLGGIIYLNGKRTLSGQAMSAEG